MDEREKELLATYRAEANNLFVVNQAGRTAAERVMGLIVSIVGVAIAAGIGADTTDVAIPLPAHLLLLVTYTFHQYADLTVVGKAREVLEERVNEILDAEALVYEVAVADVRKHGLLAASVRMLQGLGVALVAATLVVGIAVVVRDHPWYVQVGFFLGTGAALATAALAFVGMLRSGKIAEDKIDERLKQLAAKRGSLGV